MRLHEILHILQGQLPEIVVEFFQEIRLELQKCKFFRLLFCQIMLNQLEEEAPTSSLAATQSTNTDRRLFAQELPLSPIEEETLIRSILREEEAAYFEAITILLKAGRSPKAILDAIQIASARVVLAIADPPAYSMPQHGFEYTNTLAWFYANFEH